MKLNLEYFLFFFVCNFAPGYLQSHNRLILFPTVKNFSINHLLYSTSDYKCESSDDCADFIQGSICQQESCVCPKPLLLSRDKTKCLKPAIEFGSQCEDDIQCSETLLSGGVCLGNVCKCKTGYHYLKGTCWKSQKLKEKCIRNEQCFSNYDYRGQECKEKICTCRPDYYNRLNSGCRKARNLGESCNIDSDCPGESTCEKMKCAKAQMKINKKPPFVFELNDSIPDTEGENLTCPKGSYNLNGKCVLELGMTCTTDSNCTHIAKASCLDNVCSCEPVLAIANENNRKCLQVARGKIQNITQAPCKEDPQCAVFSENSFCLDKKCACKNGTYWEAKNQLCWLVKELGQTCFSDQDCHPSERHAKCQNSDRSAKKVCVCDDGYYARNKTCLPEAKKVGDYCEHNDNCLFNNSFCNSTTNSCACLTNYYFENEQCVKGVGSACENDDECAHIENAKCLRGNSTEKLCQCKADYVSGDDFRFCLPVSVFGQSCLKSFQCQFKMGQLAKCANETCQCEDGAHLFESQCYRSRLIGQSCIKIQECFLQNNTDSIICLNGYCSCHYDYTLHENGDCKKTNSASHGSIIHPFFSTLILLFIAFGK